MCCGADCATTENGAMEPWRTISIVKTCILRCCADANMTHDLPERNGKPFEPEKEKTAGPVGQKLSAVTPERYGAKLSDGIGHRS